MQKKSSKSWTWNESHRLTHFCVCVSLCGALRFIIILNRRLSTYSFRISLKYVSYINKKKLKSNNIEVTKVIQGQPFEYNRDNTSATHWFTFAIEMCLSSCLMVWWWDLPLITTKKLIGFCKSVYTINNDFRSLSRRCCNYLTLLIPKSHSWKIQPSNQHLF